MGAGAPGGGGEECRRSPVWGSGRRRAGTRAVAGGGQGTLAAVGRRTGVGAGACLGAADEGWGAGCAGRAAAGCAGRAAAGAGRAAAGAGACAAIKGTGQGVQGRGGADRPAAGIPDPPRPAVANKGLPGSGGRPPPAAGCHESAWCCAGAPAGARDAKGAGRGGASPCCPSQCPAGGRPPPTADRGPPWCAVGGWTPPPDAMYTPSTGWAPPPPPSPSNDHGCPASCHGTGVEGRGSDADGHGSTAADHGSTATTPGAPPRPPPASGLGATPNGLSPAAIPQEDSAPMDAGSTTGYECINKF